MLLAGVACAELWQVWCWVVRSLCYGLVVRAGVARAELWQVWCSVVRSLCYGLVVPAFDPKVSSTLPTKGGRDNGGHGRKGEYRKGEGRNDKVAQHIVAEELEKKTKQSRHIQGKGRHR